ncbi:MAG TPA: DUF58 domain-containing protein [Pirellulales bacterium]|jgi:hypothetical protein|nr:DUF58 domain-containing protein [Pirellulales bacterium]
MRKLLLRLYENGFTREGEYYLFVFGFVVGGGIIREINLLLLFSGLLAAPLLWSGFAAGRAVRGVSLRRVAPKLILAGDRLQVQLLGTLRRAAPSARWFVAKDRLTRIDNGADDPRRTAAAASNEPTEIASPSAPRALSPPRAAKPFEVAVQLPCQAQRTQLQGEYQGVLLERGRYEFGPLKLSTTFPWGLMRRTVSQPETQTLLVGPRLGRLLPGWNHWQPEKWHPVQQSRLKQGTDGEFYGLRDWRPGDDRRTVHWRTSARRGNLIVRQFEQTRSREVALFLELWSPTRPTPADRERIELALSCAATIVQEVCRHGSTRMLLAVAGVQVQVLQGVASSRFWQEAMEMLACCQPTAKDQLAELHHAVREASTAEWFPLVLSTRAAELDPAADVPSRQTNSAEIAHKGRPHAATAHGAQAARGLAPENGERHSNGDHAKGSRASERIANGVAAVSAAEPSCRDEGTRFAPNFSNDANSFSGRERRLFVGSREFAEWFVAAAAEVAEMPADPGPPRGGQR